MLFTIKISESIGLGGPWYIYIYTLNNDLFSLTQESKCVFPLRLSKVKALRGEIGAAAAVEDFWISGRFDMLRNGESYISRPSVKNAPNKMCLGRWMPEIYSCPICC